MSSPLILKDFAIPLGSTVLVTGANGLIGSHVVDQFIHAGFHVRGTVRDVKRCSWMIDFFSKKYGDGKFELVQVEGMEKAGCFDEAVKGTSGVVHTTSSVNMTATDPHPAVEQNVKTVMTALESSLTEPTVKRFVLTSSAWAAAAPKPDVEHTITKDTWNDDGVADAWAKGEPRSNGITIFMAGKTQAEREAWKWMQEKKPHFAFSAVLPDTVFGTVLDPVNQGIPSTSGCIQMLFNGQNIGFLKMILPQYFIDVVDNAKLHVAALVHPQAVNERLFGYAEPFSWDDILTMFREMFPEKKFIDDLKLGRDVSTVPNGRALELLKLVYGQEQWTGLEASIKATVSSFIDSGAGAGGSVASQLS
jgi:nucleoside-diphosphate-sugar epimerase